MCAKKYYAPIGAKDLSTTRDSVNISSLRDETSAAVNNSLLPMAWKKRKDEKGNRWATHQTEKNSSLQPKGARLFRHAFAFHYRQFSIQSRHIDGFRKPVGPLDLQLIYAT